MNTNQNAIKVLCYGDSNTYGQKPDKTGRYEANVRWTGVLQNLLGDSYYIIEEGLGSRTTDLEYSKKPGRNGKTYLIPCLQSHNPIDIVVIMLGTNDLKIEYHRPANAIAKAIGGLVEDVRNFSETKTGKTPRIIVISPIKINDQAPRFAEFYTGYYDAVTAAESDRLSIAIKTIAEEKDCLFLDAAAVAQPGEDGIHMDESSQKPLAEKITRMIQNLETA